MVLVTPTLGKYRGKRRFRFTEESERRVLEEARDFFFTAYLLLSKGLEHKVSKSGATSCFNVIKRGSQRNGIYTISIEDWERIQHYAKLKRRGKVYSEY